MSATRIPTYRPLPRINRQILVQARAALLDEGTDPVARAHACGNILAAAAGRSPASLARALRVSDEDGVRFSRGEVMANEVQRVIYTDNVGSDLQGLRAAQDDVPHSPQRAVDVEADLARVEAHAALTGAGEATLDVAGRVARAHGVLDQQEAAAAPTDRVDGSMVRIGSVWFAPGEAEPVTDVEAAMIARLLSDRAKGKGATLTTEGVVSCARLGSGHYIVRSLRYVLARGEDKLWTAAVLGRRGDSWVKVETGVTWKNSVIAQRALDSDGLAAASSAA